MPTQPILKYLLKPKVLLASRWYRAGDHDRVRVDMGLNSSRRSMRCSECRQMIGDHGWMKASNAGDPTTGGANAGDVMVCPGDYIVDAGNGLVYPIKPSEFEAMTQPLAETEAGPLAEREA